MHSYSSKYQRYDADNMMLYSNGPPRIPAINSSQPISQAQGLCAGYPAAASDRAASASPPFGLPTKLNWRTTRIISCADSDRRPCSQEIISVRRGILNSWIG